MSDLQLDDQLTAIGNTLAKVKAMQEILWNKLFLPAEKLEAAVTFQLEHDSLLACAWIESDYLDELGKQIERLQLRG